MTKLPISRSGVGGFSFPRQAGRRVLAVFDLIGGGGNIFSPFIMYSAKKCSFSDGCKRQ